MAGEGGSNAGNDIRYRTIFNHITLHLYVHRCIKHGFILVHSEKDNLDRQLLLSQGSHYLKAVHTRHVHIQHDNIRLMLPHTFEGHRPVLSFSHYFQTCAHLYDLSQSGAKDGMIVRYEYAYLRIRVTWHRIRSI